MALIIDGRKIELLPWEEHQLEIARRTLKMAGSILGVMGGMSKSEAQRVIRELTAKYGG